MHACEIILSLFEFQKFVVSLQHVRVTMYKTKSYLYQKCDQVSEIHVVLKLS